MNKNSLHEDSCIPDQLLVIIRVVLALCECCAGLCVMWRGAVFWPSKAEYTKRKDCLGLPRQQIDDAFSHKK